MFERLSTRVDNIASKSTANYEGEGSGDQPIAYSSGARKVTSSGYLTPKTMKLNFLRFNDAEDPTSWLCRAEQFFEIHDTPIHERVSLASFHLEGEAQLWYQLLKQEKPIIVWEEFKDGLNSHYEPDQFFEFFFCEFTKLQQIGTVQDYQKGFEKLLAKAGLLPKSRQVSCFISGHSIRADVQANKPERLTLAIGLARLYEAKNSYTA